MTAYVKHLPAGVTPASDVRTWGVEASRRWLEARVPAVFAPVEGSWVLGVLVTVALADVLRGGGAERSTGTAWLDYAGLVLLVALPLWYRFLPGATVVSALLLALGPAVGRGGVPVCLAAAWALTGALLRLRARRRQARAVLDAAGTARFPLPERLPRGHDRRGYAALLPGAFLSLAGAGILLDGLLDDLGAHGAAVPYDAVGQQGVALPLLVFGSTLLGRGWTADRASRRLYDAPQPVLVVGVRASRSGHFWLLPDADDTAARPLISLRPRREDRLAGARLLARGTDALPGRGTHDIDAYAEPFEAVLYGVPVEGAEIVLECAVQGHASVTAHVIAAPLLPRRRHGLGPWTPAGVSHSATEEARRARERERWQAREPLRRPRPGRTTAAGTAGGTGTASTAGGCGGGGGGCGGDGCGGGCGGCGCG
ncbi:hypothetical protein AB0F18_36060 [Streptomyces sp. NPDC029216]|uniref:hypothetical protein n=1 Tax=Streptomyces sp. NPDC029216 TaxID=3154701 RepID=UPI0033C6474F